jgi:pseudouridine-5'-phosphate glycosidase
LAASVPVIGYRTSEFPAFYSRRSGVKLDHSFNDARAIAQAIGCHWSMGGGGVVIANPIPESEEIVQEEIGEAIDRALAAAKARNIGQKEVTPFLLARVAEFTGGRSMAANKALICHNARAAAEIAVVYSQLKLGI